MSGGMGRTECLPWPASISIRKPDCAFHHSLRRLWPRSKIPFRRSTAPSATTSSGRAPRHSRPIATRLHFLFRTRDGPHRSRARNPSSAGGSAIADGEAIQGEMVLMESGQDVACKLVAWFPRMAQGTRTGTLVARSESENFLIALNEKDEKLWVYNGDQLPRWAAEHRDQLQRWSEDQKAEHRPVPPFAERRGHTAAKYKQRMTSACHAIAAMLVGYADRRRFAAIRWDDSDQS